MPEIVMSLGVDEREAVVVRTPDNRLTLTERGARFGVGLPNDGLARSPVGGRVAVAGRLARGVAAVTVIDDAGAEHAATIQGELWMVVVDTFSEDLVRYVDADGELVTHARRETVQGHGRKRAVSGVSARRDHRARHQANGAGR